MTITSAYAPFNTSYEQRTPYLTAAEFNVAGTAVDTTQLIPGGNSQAQATALTEIIGRASSWVDQFTCGAWGTLAATAEIENARIWGSYRGTLPVKTKYWPILEVISFSYASLPGGLTGGYSASINPAETITIYPQEFEVSLLSGVIAWNLGAPAGIVRGIEYDCVWQYISGWPNTTLAASVSAGSASISPMVLTGIYPNTQLNIYDLPNDENIQVASTYVPGTTPVPLTAPLQYDHVAATVTNLPPAVKQAAIFATAAFIKQRGSGGLIVSDITGSKTVEQGAPQNTGSDFMLAKQLLQPFKQMVVSY